MRKLATALLVSGLIVLGQTAVKQGTHANINVSKPQLDKASSTKKSNVAKATPIKQVKTASVVAKAEPAPAPIPQDPAPIVYSVGCEQYLPIVQQYNWNVSVAMAIMQAESGCDPNQVSPASINWDGVSDYGLFQIHGVAVMDPSDNVAYAYYHKYVQSGWTPWSTYTSGKYLRYL